MKAELQEPCELQIKPGANWQSLKVEFASSANVKHLLLREIFSGLLNLRKESL